MGIDLLLEDTADVGIGISEGTENGGGMRNKTAIEVNEAEKTLEIFDGGGLRIISDSLDMRG